MEKGFIMRMNELGHARIPFLFLIDFEKKKPRIWPLAKLPEGLRFSMPGITHHSKKNTLLPSDLQLVKYPTQFELYQKAFEKVKVHLQRGDTYLLNLTFPTEITCNYTAEEIFGASIASYKLLVPNQFLCFSPEIFVRIQNNRISSYPMKGTIDASVVHAEEHILNDMKETAEHNTIIDLIRNDLSIVAKDVSLDRYRYIDRLKTHEGELLQVSSEISGNLPSDWASGVGDILNKLLPAGSISGAPKEKTLEIIRETEGLERGYYTGVFGVFDGENLDSAVLIRYIDLQNKTLAFRSGGGITAKSNCLQEYNELIQKVYVPIA